MNFVLFQLLLILPFFIFSLNAEEDELAKAAYGVDLQVSNVLKKKYGLVFSGVELGAPDDKILEMGLFFRTTHPYHTKKELRQLVVACVEEYLTAIFENCELQKFLSEFFSVKDITLKIFNCTENGKNMEDHPNISVAGVYNGNLIYRTFFSDNESSYDEKETYEEALAIVKAEQN